MEEIGRSIIRLESVDSTNNYTANRAKLGELRHGAVIMAVDQVLGKGQMGSKWQSEAGLNLTCSIFLDNVNLSVERQFLLTKIVSLSMLDLLENFDLKAQIKWPNDIYINEKKIAGVLIENTLHGKMIGRSIVGIGLNVNQKEFGALNATSLSKELGGHIPLDSVLFSLISVLNKRFKSWPNVQLDEAYKEALMWRNQWRTYEDANGEFLGKIIGTNVSGKLKMEGQLGVEKLYGLKEVRFIR